ncbi:MAG TPA: acyl-CoA dehydrogenase [Acidimicrobiales bacterium]|nr:acyl-CoA dehydrogenase [Acidimicrobiales bacterium]
METSGSLVAAGEARGTEYRAPIADIRLALDTVGIDELLGLAAFRHVDRRDIDAALAEFGRFAAEVIAPTDRPGDLAGSTLDPSTGSVTTPAGFKDAYRRYADGGWGNLQFPIEYGGAGLPSVVGLAIQEIFASANLSLSLNPVLTQSGVELLLSWASDEQRAKYLPKLLSGEWSATMNLTEPDAGSDLAEVKTYAQKASDGTWRISGTKIFITWGEHDLTENIVHLVLARTPGAPPGTRGLSLFLVPKYLVDAQGGTATRNQLKCQRLEEKLGIHASPTCVMEYEGAFGELLGEELSGLRAMFTMMNIARVAIGIEGPAVAERAYQQAERYAAQRLQGRDYGDETGTLVPIIEHPDVRRMLLRMRTSTQAARLLAYEASMNRDLAQHAEDPSARAWSKAFADFLTPIAKAWSSDAGFAAASDGMQVLGGAGYVEESGIAQRLRDSRIAPIYEGTNGIQAIDLVVRKIGRDDGVTVRRLITELRDFITRESNADKALLDTFSALEEAVTVLESTTRWIEERLPLSPNDVLAGATTYLELAGITLGGWLMARRALLAGASEGETATRVVGESNFFATEFVGRAAGLVRPITSGADRLSTI